MDECSGEVLPFPREVVDGLRSFAFGLNVAFLLAGLTQTFLFLSRLGNRTGIKTSFIAKFISALTILVHFISLSESSGQFYDSGYYYIIQDTNR